MSAANGRTLERFVRFCLGFSAFLAGMWFLEVPALPFRQWFPGGVFLGMAFAIWMGGKSSKPNASRLPPQRSGGRQDAVVGASELEGKP
jgi:hypothetical protein